MNGRIEALKDTFLSATRMVDTERAVLVTESYKNNEDKSDPMKRALSIRHVMENMTITIRENELLVGCHTPYVRSAPLFPEYASGWISAQIGDFSTRQGDQFAVTDEQMAEVHECLKYWKGRSLDERIAACVPEELQRIIDYNVFYNANYPSQSPGHIVANFEYLLKTGFDKIINICKEKIAGLDINEDDFIDKREFYLSCIEIMQATIDYTKRFAVLARDLAEKEKDPARKAELLQIAENCENVPAKPASSYWEALQFVFIVQMTILLEGNGLGVALGRIDKYLYPYYEADLKAGKIDHDAALELMECFYLKLSELDKIASNESTAVNTGPAHGQTITIGGTLEDGSDITNDISILILEADRDVGLSQPDIAVRIHRNTSQRLIDAATVNVKSGLNKVKIYNDVLIKEAVERIGYSKDESYNFSFLGCSEPVVDGTTNSWGNSGHINLVKCLELALNDGKCMLTGVQMGPHTGEASGFKTIDDVKAAYRKQVNYFTDALVQYDRIIDMCHKKYSSLPFCSVVIDGCIEKGVDFERGGARYNFTSPLGVAPITVGDSLMAVKKLVFDDKKLEMDQLIHALKNDFAGEEPLRMMLKNRAPKFGNDIDEADEMSSFAMAVYCDALEKYKNARGGIFTAGIYYLTANVPNGERTAATPNGRHAGEPLNDGGISPTHGDDKQGATAIFKSAGKLCNVRAGHGSVLNQLLHPSIFNGKDGERVFGEYMRSIVDCGVWETQFNVITRDDLIRAQQSPDEYRSLVVRVAGYSAFFTVLGKGVQDDIIDRTSLLEY
ncbi:glycyl radical protein [Christensenella timonensis]|uniref:glycyl radical protein n=1 Tax=Christensenella timonensis TaxID=1816678 RepID=UPI00093BE9DA|nr:formate C-acetyltransferase/glycerol dehydratase family glycyl radical enzyme [Christensenella timonensis]